MCSAVCWVRFEPRASCNTQMDHFMLAAVVLLFYVGVVNLCYRYRLIPMSDESFQALCRDPAATVYGISRHLGNDRRRLCMVLDHVVDDTKCAHVLCGEQPVLYEAFIRRSLAFYLRFKNAVFYGADVEIYTLGSILRDPRCTDVVNKVEFILENISWRSSRWEDAVVDGLNHSDIGVQRQFVGIVPLVAVFLVPLPPRVQCRVLENTRVGIAE